MESDILHKPNFNNSNNSNSGPRVKFNRDVHVKRYGSGNYEPNSADLVTPSTHPPAQHQPKQPTLNFRRELPQDLSEEALRREAALVLEQANHFGSLPLRKNRGKPVRRSISDASTKKPKKNSILNLFATNINAKSSSLEPESPKKIERSKSDASRTSSLKRDKHKIQLSNNHTNSLTNSSDSENFLLTSTPHKKIQLSPITEVQGRGDYFDEVDRSGEQVEAKKKPYHFGNIGFTSHEDLDLIPTTEKKANKSFKSMEEIHCSQMPPEKPQLTKGVAVDSMIKRLSLERFSPPPQILTAGGFSYTNPHSPLSPLLNTRQQSLSPLTINAPNENDVVYAQVVCNESSNGNKKHKSTVHNTIKKYRSNSPPNTKHNNYNSHNDTVDFGGKLNHKSFSDPDEGFGNELKSKFTEEYHDEPVIKPTIRLRGPERVGVTKTFISAEQDEHNGYNGFNDHHLHNGNNSKFFDMRDMEYNDLSYRREILESRIKSRIGGLRTESTFVQKQNRHNHVVPPPRAKDRKYHKFESKEITTRYSPDRNHHDVISPATDLNYHLEQQPLKYTQHDYMDSSLRNKNYYYSKNADRGDSGIEHDYRKDSIDDHKLRSRFNIGRKWNFQDDIIESELFLMKERKHTQETNPPMIRTFIYRERSIDDGSHYDPNIDKLNIIRERRHNEKVVKDFIKSRKKKSGMEKVRELFKPKKPSMVEHNELSSRYREYSPKPEPEISAQQHIANRRRLSTPTSSPITNRSTSLPPKTMRGNKTVSALAKSSTLVKKDKENINSSQKFSWFSSLDRLAKKKPKESSFEKTSSQLSKSDKSSSMRALPTNSMTNGSSKTLRFFGDTDNDDTISKGRSKRIFNQHSSQPILQEHKSSTLIRTKKPYQTSAYELNSANDDDYYKTYRTKSISLQNLNSNRKPKSKITRSRTELQNISESTSDTEVNGTLIPLKRYSPVMNKSLPPPRPPKSNQLSTTLPRNHQSRKFDREDVDRTFLHRDVREASPFRTKKDFFESETNLTSARKMRERSLSSSRERERNDSDASQRSVVYLHATTVGDIPQTMGSEGRSKISGRSSVKTAIQEQKPMTRSVARSVSMSAPWKPKFRSGEYEINYSPENNQMNQTKQSTATTTPRSKTASRERLSDRYSRSDKRLDLSHTKRI